MAGIQLSGLASGLDWQSLITQLVTAERSAETPLQNRQALNTTKTSGLATINQDLLDLQTAVNALGTSSFFSGRSASIASSGTGWSTSAEAGVPAGQYTFNVSQLATTASVKGAANVSASLSATSDVSGVTLATMNVATPVTAGIFTVNGAQVSIALTDSLQNVFSKISTATGGAVTASYNPASDKVSLTSASPIILGAANDTSNFLSSLHLYNNGTGSIISPTALGNVSVSAAIQNANLKTAVTNVDASGNGSFAINGVNIAFNTHNDSLTTVLNSINNSSAGVTASYDQNTGRFSLANATTGDTGISVSESAGGLLEALGLKSTGTFTRGANANFSVNGGSTIVSSSNVLDGSTTGITGLSVTATSATAQTINVSSDTTGANTAINTFISKYNAIQSYIDAQTKTTTGSNGKVTTSTFSGNLEVSNLATSLRSIVFSAVPGLSGSIQRLDNIGIGFTSGSTQLQVTDATKLNNALSNNSSVINTLFNGSGGISAQINSFVTKNTGATGSIATQTNTLNQNSQSITNQIATMERRITAEQARMTAQFVAMEKAQSLLQQQSQALTNAFGGTSGSSSSKGG